MPSLVQKGDTIYVHPEFLSDSKSNRMTVSWSQNWFNRTEKYKLCKFTVKSGGDAKGLIYVQANKVAEFKSKKTSGEDFTLTVDESFQYGQDKDQTKRFLVFHDTDNRPYQHRFVENTLTELGDGANEYVKEFTGVSFEAVGMMAKMFVGDYLHNF
ncbi:uncharacterized protein J4E84_010200 [Alternaria hordeiaustralica]|uniref:uncharacterized protein n=1 Tax=Alternaria hordeiaustralica TaxID=1187925 RepID=UPI0020C4D5AA|nr:uncharacterized protein J4E84_010200 [Alternaria hordeiaustralica]KAI4675308.1 hypothetical protein J4E84_010200 [Alternaria hordeiaustralica]